MKRINLLLFYVFLVVFVINLGCGGVHTRPKPPCSTPYVCLKIKEVNAAGSCCGNSLVTIIENKNPSKGIWAVVFQDTLIGSTWIFDKSDLIYVPKSSNIKLGCGHIRKASPQNGEQCDPFRRWRVANACFDDDKDCKIKLPDNSDLPQSTCWKNCANCNPIDFGILTSSQKNKIRSFYRGLLNSQVNPVTERGDIVSVFSPSSSPNPNAQIIFNNNRIEGTGHSASISPLLPTPINFPGSTQTYDKLWVESPSVVTGTITRNTNSVTVDFTLSRQEFITVEALLEPSDSVRTDVIKQIYIDKRQNKMWISGDFICFHFKNID